ncbi:MAG TPA: VCBS repeat-containing protein [Urbifossiella sp.]|nr:VCBS repeat-containing protein [Urbifossiella sp.]
MNRTPLRASLLRVEQLEDRLTPDASAIPAGEFNWEQYSPTGELAQLVWEGQTLVYRTRAANAWFEEPIAVSSDFTQAQYSTRNQVQSAAESAQLVFTGDGTPHVLFLQESWNSQANAFQTLVQHYERIGGQWEHVETISAPWLSTWGPSNLVAEPGAGNTLHILFSETYTAATGVGNFGTGILWYGTNTSGSWQFAKVADTADPRVDVWFSGGDWAPRFISMAIDANNNAYVTYTPEFYIAGAFSTVYSQLNFATNRGGSWQTSTIYAPQDGTADAGLGASIAINPTNGQVSVASYYVDRYNTGSPQTSKLMYHTLNANGTWTNSDVVTAPDDYSAADGPHFTGFTPQLFFSASGQANIVFSDEASQHLPVTFANEYAGQIRMATFNGGKWSVQTVYRQNDPIHNQLFYPIAATYKGQTTFGGLQAVSQLDGNLNITSTSFSLVDVNAPAGPSTPAAGGSTLASPPTPQPPTLTQVNSSKGLPTAGAPKPAAMAVATDSQAGIATSVAVYNSDGSLDFSITPFGPTYTGGARVARADVNGDGVPDIIVGSGGGIQARVRIWDGATHQLIFDVTPFESFTGGVVLATGDLNGDGKADVIIGPDAGGGPRVQVWAGGTLQKLMPDFFGLPYPTFRGGLRLASADVNRDGTADLIVAPGAGGGPRITLYDGKSLTSAGGPRLIVSDFFAFDPNSRYGMFLASGDINGDGYADIVVGMGIGTSPEVRIIDGKDLATGQGVHAIADFFVASSKQVDGARVGITNIDGDNKADVLVGTQGGVLSLVTGAAITSSPVPSLALSFPAFTGITGGIYVG